MSRVVDLARSKGIGSVTLSAVPSAVTFYRRYGFEPNAINYSEPNGDVDMTYFIESKRERRARKQREAKQRSENIVRLTTGVAYHRREAERMEELLRLEVQLASRAARRTAEATLQKQHKQKHA